MSKTQTKSQTKTKVVLSEEDIKKELDIDKENVKEDFVDYLFRFGKYRNMLASQIVSIETINPKTKQKQQQGLQYLKWCLANVLFLLPDDKKIIQQIIDNYTSK